MSSSTTMTIRVNSEVKAKLDRLARDTQRSRSYLAAAAVSGYVDRELKIVAGIQQGIADRVAGRTVSHDDAMAEIDAVIDAVTGTGEHKRPS